MVQNPFDIYTDEYEKWFEENKTTFQSELLAIRQVMPTWGKGIEIGIGSGIFAVQLGINFGIDPSDSMLDLAKKRNLNVVKGFAENLPYPDESFDFAAFITSICFIESPDKAINEVHRILKAGGEIIVAFIDRNSRLGHTLIKEKEGSKFYSVASFYSVPEVIAMIEKNGFKISEIVQTLTVINASKVEQPMKGFGKGSFVVISALKL
jgi:ubiquinone/menaquinone biosynthesis C-methylase UbiE